MKKIVIILSIIGALLTFNTCSEDFLNVPPFAAYSPDNLTSKTAVDKLLMACYSAISGECDWHGDLMASPTQVCFGQIWGGEALKGGPSRQDFRQFQEFQEYAVTVSNSRLVDHFMWVWDAVDRCNFVINQLDIVDMTAADKTEIEAEARFLRAHYYFMGKRVYGNIPWIDENTTDVRVPNTVDNDGVTYVNIWPQIAADMDFARKNLPVTQDDWGRPNKWAADAYYAKILIYRANYGEYANGYSEALTILNDIMTNGVNQGGVKYALVPYFGMNYSAATENNSETVYALQMSVNDGVSAVTRVFGLGPKGNVEPKIWNTQAADGPGFGTGWGFYQPTQWFVDHFRVNPNGLPYLDMFETNPHSIKSDMGILSTEPFEPDTCSVDPRLDMTVGRRGIPYLDYGIYPGKRWIRGQEFGGPYMTKKFVTRVDEVGIYTPDALNWTNAINVPVIRYADVLLFAAECEARVGSLDNARDLVNQIRNRMVQNSDNPNHWVKLDDGVTNAANYKIGLYPDDGSADDAFTNQADALDAILYERTLELGFEGHRFHDVQRFGKDEEEFPAIIEFMTTILPWFSQADYTRVPDRYAPIPRTAVDNSQVEGKPTLTQNPGY